MTPETILARCLDCIGPVSAAGRQEALDRLLQLTMPHWAMGRLMELALDLAAIGGSRRVSVARKAVVVMAGDHGVCAQGVSKYPQEVTPQMVANFVAGGATINALAGCAGAEVVIVDMGVKEPIPPVWASGVVRRCSVGPGTGDISREPAMSREQALAALAVGIGLAGELAPRIDCFACGEMGIGNTTPSAAITACCCGRSAAEVTGRGTGLDDDQHRAKVAVVETALARAALDGQDGLALLRELGGFEIGGLAGLMLGAAAAGRPVVLDGFITTAAALIAVRICPQVRDYLIASHRGLEPGHAIQLAWLGKEPLLELELRLGEGSGAALALPLLDGAASLLTQVATFAEAAVSEAEGA
jgi:nicotinate-nucleotide--dimethylbenzimidazole phosphoribosyltransferase